AVVTVGAVSVIGEPISVPVEPLGLVAPPVQQPTAFGSTGSQCTWMWFTPLLRVHDTVNVCPLTTVLGGVMSHVIVCPGLGLTRPETTSENPACPLVAWRTWAT